MEFPVEASRVEIPVPYIDCEVRNEGNDAVLDVSINGHLIPQQSSKSRDTLIIHTTSAEMPTLPIVVEWGTVLAITASPRRIVWSGSAGAGHLAAVSLAHSGGKAFNALGIQSTWHYLRASSPTNISAAEHKLNIVMDAEAKAGMYYEKVIIKLDGPEQNELEISVAVALR